MEIIIAFAVLGLALWWFFLRTPADTTPTTIYKAETAPAPVVEAPAPVVEAPAPVVEVAAAPVKKPRKPRAPKAVVEPVKVAVKKAAPKKAAAIKAAPKARTPRSKKI